MAEQKKKKIVIKIGSSLLVEKGKIRLKWIENLAENVAKLIAKNSEIVIVSSGAIAVGREAINKSKDKLSLWEKQASSALGQVELTSCYHKIFAQFDLKIAQILLTAADCNSRKRYLNAQNTLEILLKQNIVPVVNENDFVAIDEIKIGDNDRLAARIAQMISADLLILLSDIDGLYDKNPRIEKNAKFIPEVANITKEIEDMAGGAGSSVGTGGMATKIKAAKMASSAGCKTIITNGQGYDVLEKIFNDWQNYTIFHSKEKSTKSKKTWLSGMLNSTGEVVVNECARVVLMKKKSSLLPVGVVSVSGEFEKGDAIFVRDENGNHIATGIANYSFSETKKIIGKNSTQIKKILGKTAKQELIHLDNLVIIE